MSGLLLLKLSRDLALSLSSEGEPEGFSWEREGKGRKGKEGKGREGKERKGKGRKVELQLPFFRSFHLFGLEENSIITAEANQES